MEKAFLTMSAEIKRRYYYAYGNILPVYHRVCQQLCTYVTRIQTARFNWYHLEPVNMAYIVNSKQARLRSKTNQCRARLYQTGSVVRFESPALIIHFFRYILEVLNL